MSIDKRIRLWLGWCPEVRPGRFQIKGGELSMIKSARSGGLLKNYRVLHEERAPQSPTIWVVDLIERRN